MTRLLIPWTRRDWVARNTAALLTLVPRRLRSSSVPDATTVARRATQAVVQDPTLFQDIAQHAVDAARTAGANYADVRLTRVVRHSYWFFDYGRIFSTDEEITGVGVRALVNGYWGFAACPWRETDAAADVARTAVAQAQVNAKGPSRMVELGTIPVATGHWRTPIRIDPFGISVEDKLEMLGYWMQYAKQYGVYFPFERSSHLVIERQEQVLATSEGTLVTQTLYASGGDFHVWPTAGSALGNNPTLDLQGLAPAGAGWELFLDADIPGQLQTALETLRTQIRVGSKPSTVGRYTLVCDGATMAALTSQTVGVATQLDRAMGYEADADGTSFLDDPLAQVGQLHVAAPAVTVTANRTAPKQLATVQWDAEGVVPVPFPLIKDGILTDFQTTREQAAWLASYYARIGQPVRSHGCAAMEDALSIPMAHMPNLALVPGAAAIQLADLVADVPHGILVTHGSVETDFQARTGLLDGTLREITNGRLGRTLTGGAILFDTLDLWKHVTAIGGPGTVMTVATPAVAFGMLPRILSAREGDTKGQPAQTTGYSVQAAAATITNQPLIDPTRRA